MAESVINRNYPELLDDNHFLHFYLQIQHLIELIRDSKVDEAVAFAQEDIVEKGDYPECLPDLERAMGLLAFQDPHKSPFSDLLQPGFRLKVQNSPQKLKRKISLKKIKIRPKFHSSSF